MLLKRLIKRSVELRTTINAIMLMILVIFSVPLAFADQASDRWDATIHSLPCNSDVTTTRVGVGGSVENTVALDTGDKKLGAGSCDFTGAGRIKFASIVGFDNPDLTCEWWFKWDTGLGGGENAWFMHYMNANPPNEQGEFSQVAYGTDTDLWVYKYYDTDSQESTNIAVGFLHDGAWNHMAFVRDVTGVDSLHTYYINGDKADDDTTGTVMSSPVSTDFWLGQRPGVPDVSSGWLDEINCYDIAMDSTMITYIYNSGDGRENTAPETNSCSCPVSGDWSIEASDNCVISTDCDMQGNNAICSGSGTLTFQAVIRNINSFSNHGGCSSACHLVTGCYG